VRWNPNPEGGNNEREGYAHVDLIKSYDKSTYAWQPNMSDKILRVSKSSLSAYDWCPQQYFIEKVLGLGSIKEADYLTRGSNIHDAVEYWWKAMEDVVDDVYAFIKKRDKNGALALCLEALPTPPEPYLYGEPEQLTVYVKWQLERLCLIDEDEIQDWFPVGNEAEIHANRIVTASDGTDVPIHMKGYIDRIFLDDDKIGFVLMELKSGKWTKYKPAQMRAEMQFYRMMLEHSPHMEYLPVTGWGWQYPGGGINGGDGPRWDFESVSGPGGRYAPRTVEKKLTGLIDAHLNMDFPPLPAIEKRGKSQYHEDRRYSRCDTCEVMEFCCAYQPKEMNDNEE
tara:strand:+ start:183 stop:1199 length:1017 start_codon:yes stop_codon:yes gene_type:complete